MGTRELHLSERARPEAGTDPRSCFRVAGESMEFFLRTGDVLHVLRGGEAIRVGDLVLFMGGDRPPIMLAHRVLARWGAGALLAKGDFHLLPDGVIRPEARIGRVRAVERDGRRVWLDCGWARSAGLLMAAYSYAGASAYRLTQLGSWALRLAFPWSERLLPFLETVHFRFIRRPFRVPPELLFAALARHSESAHAGELSSLPRAVDGRSPTASGGLGSISSQSRSVTLPRELPAGGEISGDVEWSGGIRVFGDVVVLPGATLTVRAGTKVALDAGKRLHHGMRRRWEGASHELADAGECQIAVYGTLRVEGEKDSPVVFDPGTGVQGGAWGGIVLSGPGARVHSIRHAVIKGARHGVRCLDGARLRVEETRFLDARSHCVRATGRARALIRDCLLDGAAFGVSACERSFVALSGCEGTGLRTAVSAKGEARLRLKGCRLTPGPAPALREGVRLEDAAIAHVRDCAVEGYPIGLLARGSARCRASRCRLAGNGLGVFAEEDARLRLRRCALHRSRTHGLWLKDRAAVSLRLCRVSGNAHNGLYATEAARLAVRDSVLWRNRAGIAFAPPGANANPEGPGDGAPPGSTPPHGRSRIAGCLLSGNREGHFSASGGRHRLDGCRFAAGPTAVSLSASAKAAMSDCEVVSCSRAGLNLHDRASALVLRTRLRRNQVGLLLEDAAEVELAGVSVEAGLSHGVWLRGGSSAVFSDVGLLDNKDNGVFLVEAARAELSGGRLSGNRCGLACADGSRSRARGCRFDGNEVMDVSVEGGEHRLEGCESEGSPVGVAALGGARLAMSRCRVLGHGRQGLSLSGAAAVEVEEGVFHGNGTAVAAGDGARLSFRGGEVRAGSGHGLWMSGSSRALFERVSLVGNRHNGAYLQDGAFVELSSSRLRGNRCALACEGDSRSESRDCDFAGSGAVDVSLGGGEHSLARCVLEGAPVGLSALEGARVSLSGCRVLGHAQEGLSLSGKALAEVETGEFDGNGIALVMSGEARGDFRGGALRGSAAHGAWLTGSARAAFAGTGFSGNKDNGLYLDEDSRAELSESGLEGNGCGLACEGGARTESKGCRFVSNGTAGLSLAGGRHRFEGCRVEGAPVGLSAHGSADVGVVETVFSANSYQGLRLADEASARLSEVRQTGSRVGLAGEGRSQSVSTDCAFSENAEADVSLAGGEHRLEGCRLEGAPVGLGALGGRVSLSRCRVAGHEREGLSLSGATAAESSEVVVEASGIGVTLADEARLSVDGGWVRASLSDGVRLFGKATARVEGAEISANRGSGAVAEGEASLSILRGAVRRNGGHGVWVSGKARARLDRVTVSSNDANGFFASGESRAEAREAEFPGNGCGLACSGAALAVAARCRFARSKSENVSLSERGRLALRDCDLVGAPAGAALHGSSRAMVRDARLLDCGRGAVLTGSARGTFLRSSWMGNEIGVWCQESSVCRIRGGSFRRHSSEAVRVSQSAALEARGVRFLRNCMAVLLEEDASAWIGGCIFRVNPTGVKADGASALALRGSRIRDCLLDGVWLGRGSRGDLLGNSFFGNRIGLHRHFEMSPRLSGNVFQGNAYGDIRRFPEEAFS